jgi:hypothetical protein
MTEFRFRTDWRGRLILQIRAWVKIEDEDTFHTREVQYWRDAKVTDGVPSIKGE